MVTTHDMIDSWLCINPKAQHVLQYVMHKGLLAEGCMISFVLIPLLPEPNYTFLVGDVSKKALRHFKSWLWRKK